MAAEISPYLHGLAMRAALHLGDGTQASITFRHHGAIVRAASSDDRSARCDQTEALDDDGPCVEAMTDLRVIRIDDLDRERRWPHWRAQALVEGFRSVLAMPAHVAPGIDVALNLYSGEADAWDLRALADAEAHAQRIAHAIGLRVQLSALEPTETRRDLSDSEIVEHAVGATMACNGCTAEEARELLATAACNRNVDLAEVAATVLLALTGVQTDRGGGARATEAPVSG